MLEGTTEKPAASSTGGISSGTASAAMVKAAAAAEASAASSSSGSGQPDGTSANTPGATTGQPTPARVEGAGGTPVAGGGNGGATIPLDRHEAVLKSARAWEDHFKKAGLDPTKDLEAAATLLSRLRTDSKGFWEMLGQQIGADGKPKTEEPLDFPPADLKSADGKAEAWSRDGVLKAIQVAEKKILATVQKQMGPLTEFYGSEMSARQRAELTEKAAAIGKKALTSARALPHFTALEPKIHGKMDELFAADPGLLEEIGPIAGMMMAYNSLLVEHGPSLTQQAEEKVREENRKKANSGGIVPNGGGGEPKKPQLNNVSDLARHMESLAAKMASA
jgi:hypothetical protein